MQGNLTFHVAGSDLRYNTVQTLVYRCRQSMGSLAFSYVSSTTGIFQISGFPTLLTFDVIKYLLLCVCISEAKFQMKNTYISFLCVRGATFYSVETVLIESTRLTLYHNVLPGSNLHFEKYCCSYCLDLAGGLCLCHSNKGNNSGFHQLPAYFESGSGLSILQNNCFLSSQLYDICVIIPILKVKL